MVREDETYLRNHFWWRNLQIQFFMTMLINFISLISSRSPRTSVFYDSFQVFRAYFESNRDESNVSPSPVWNLLSDSPSLFSDLIFLFPKLTYYGLRTFWVPKKIRSVEKRTNSSKFWTKLSRWGNFGLTNTRLGATGLERLKPTNFGTRRQFLLFLFWIFPWPRLAYRLAQRRLVPN